MVVFILAVVLVTVIDQLAIFGIAVGKLIDVLDIRCVGSCRGSEGSCHCVSICSRGCCQPLFVMVLTDKVVSPLDRLHLNIFIIIFLDSVIVGLKSIFIVLFPVGSMKSTFFYEFPYILFALTTPPCLSWPISCHRWRLFENILSARMHSCFVSGVDES